MTTSRDAFDLSSNTPEQRRVIEDAIDRCSFNFSRCLPRLKKEKNRPAIPVTWEDLTNFGAVKSAEEVVGANVIQAGEAKAQMVRRHEEHSHEGGEEEGGARRATLGLAYYSGRVVVEASLIHRPFLAQEVFLAEGAHMIDFFVLTPEQRARIFELFHEPGDPQHNHGWFEETGNNDYWSWVGEAWMIGFLQAFTDIQPTFDNFHHKFTGEDIARVRDLLDEVGSVPEPEVEYYAAKWSYAFHDQQPPHWWIHKHKIFHSRADALAAGLRPCKLCKP